MEREAIIGFKFSDKKVQVSWVIDGPKMVDALEEFETYLNLPMEDNVTLLRGNLIKWAHFTGRLSFILPRLQTYVDVASDEKFEKFKTMKFKPKTLAFEDYAKKELRPLLEMVAIINLVTKNIDTSKAMVKTVLNLEMQSREGYG